MVFGLNSERSLNVDMDTSGLSGSNVRARPAARASLARQGSVTFLGLSVSRPARYRQTSGGNRGPRMGSSTDGMDGGDFNNPSFKPVRPKAAYRRYRVGENVLVCCNSNWSVFIPKYL
jgi:hypothetical protein